MAITYQITPFPNEHIYLVRLSFIATQAHQELRLPVWIPGSYMVREFSKQITKFYAIDQKHIIEQFAKNRWNVNGLEVGETVVIEYEVYAYEYGIRTAFLDFNRGYFNPSSLCLAVTNNEASQHTIKIKELPISWQVVTGLAAVENNTYLAKNYDELIDCPFELGNVQRVSFEVAGVPHYLVLSGIIPEFDRGRMTADIVKICDYQIKLFGGVAPYSSYTFILNLSGEIYTGLEHRNSTLLMAPYYALPNTKGDNDTEYHKLMGLISHEFFHTWNVKRIKPKVFTPYDLDKENYTKLLWWFEGVTSYYDDLIMYRTGVITQEQYLQIIVDNINNVYKFSGVTTQSLANSGLTSWIKYYRQDEHSPNSIVSYYIKGALVALCLDLLIRKQSKYSLDDVMRYLYQMWCDNPVGIGENELPLLIKQATGVDLAEFIHIATETTQPLPFESLFAQFGLGVVKQVAKNHQQSGNYSILKTDFDSASIADLGVKLERQSFGYLVKNVYTAGCGAKIGLAAGDILIAINQIKLTNLERQLAFFDLGDEVELTLFRQERLQQIRFKLESANVMITDIYLIDSNQLLNWL